MKPTPKQEALLRLLDRGKAHVELDVGDSGEFDRVKVTRIYSLLELVLEERKTA